MSARLLSLKPSLYASFIAVSTSLVRLSVCVFPIFEVSELTNYTIRPTGGLVNPPTQRFFLRRLDVFPHPTDQNDTHNFSLKEGRRMVGLRTRKNPTPPATTADGRAAAR